MKFLRGIALLCCLALAACATTDNRSTEDLVRMHREAQAALDSGEDARAEVLYKGLLRAAPNDAETWLRLGNLYARTNNPEQAVEAYLKALSLNGADARTWNNLGIVRLRQAWATLIQAQGMADPKDPAYATSREIIRALEQLPQLSDMKPPKPAAGGADARKAGAGSQK